MELLQISSLDDELHEFISDYIDGKLDLVELQVFREYLQRYDRDRRFVEKVEKGKKALQKLSEHKATHGFQQRLAKRIAQERNKF